MVTTPNAGNHKTLELLYVADGNVKWKINVDKGLEFSYKIK